ncbi:hypothetical protein M1B74_03605 [Bacteroides pyogenes]|uniref:hypothetical protein n=1 Tax=Bacteroides pyogenes TaxID=310300 RepID=UPI003B429DDE
MMKRVLFLLLAALFALKLQAQTDLNCGISYEYAVPVTFSSGKTTFTDIRDTRVGPPYYAPYRYVPRADTYIPSNDTAYTYTQGRAVYYRMELPVAGDVIIHNWNSYRMGFSSIFLVRPVKPGETKDWGEGIYSCKRVATFEPGDFLSPDFNPIELGMPNNSSLGLAYLHVRNLPAGTYYIVSAGYKYMNGSVPDGQLGTTVIVGKCSDVPDEPDIKPEEPNNCPIQYRYDRSGNRIKTIKQ